MVVLNVIDMMVSSIGGTKKNLHKTIEDKIQEADSPQSPAT